MAQPHYAFDKEYPGTANHERASVLHDSGGVVSCVKPKCRSVADLAYRVILEPEPDGSAYNAIIPAFPHARTFGATVEEVMANAREIIELELDLARERDEEIPVSDSEHVVIGDYYGPGRVVEANG